MRISVAVLLGSALSLSAADPSPLVWGVQLGAVQPNSSYASLDHRTGYDVAVFREIPWSNRQAVRARIGFSGVDSATKDILFLDTQALPTWVTYPGTMQVKMRMAYVGLDYRFKWFRGTSSPYVLAGMLETHTELKINSTYEGRTHDDTLRGNHVGYTFGLGWQMGERAGIEVRWRGISEEDQASGFVAALTLRF
jgi:hypothetical protein